MRVDPDQSQVDRGRRHAETGPEGDARYRLAAELLRGVINSGRSRLRSKESQVRSE